MYFLKIERFYKNQFRFRKKHSINHVLITITEKIRNVLDNNQYACGVFLGFQKAFGTVNKRILLSKLEHYGISGIRGIPNDFIKSYLTNRKHYAHINDLDSNTLIVTWYTARLSNEIFIISYLC